MKSNYDMTFAEVLNEIFDTCGWYQGEDFADGVFISVNYNNIVVKKFNSSKYCGTKLLCNLIVTRGIANMKYRRCNTQPEIERKC